MSIWVMYTKYVRRAQPYLAYFWQTFTFFPIWAHLTQILPSFRKFRKLKRLRKSAGFVIHRYNANGPFTGFPAGKPAVSGPLSGFHKKPPMAEAMGGSVFVKAGS